MGRFFQVLPIIGLGTALSAVQSVVRAELLVAKFVRGW